MAGGGYTSDGNYLTYRVNTIEVKNDMLHVYGYAYQNNGNFDYDEKGIAAGKHCYQLVVNNTIYEDKNDYYIDHSILNSYTATNYVLYKNVGFHFEVPLDDIVETTSMHYNLTLRIYHQDRGWATIALSYMAPVETLNQNGYTLEFDTSKENTLLYTGFRNVYVRETPSKTGAVAKNDDGDSLYFTVGNVYSIEAGTMTGKTYFDSANQVYWYEVVYKEEGYSDDRHRVVASPNGETGWISDTFLTYASDPVEIKVTRNTYDISYVGMGGSNIPSKQTKWHGQDITISSNVLTRTGYTFEEWNTKSDGSGRTYQPGEIYQTDVSLVLYAIWDNQLPVLSGPNLDEYGNVNSQISPYLEGSNVIVQLGDQLNIQQCFDAYDNEDGNLTSQIQVAASNIPVDSNNCFNQAGSYYITLTVKDKAGSQIYQTVHIVVNDPPVIVTSERWFLSTNIVTPEELLNKLSVTDKEDAFIAEDVIIKQISYDDGIVVRNPTTINTILTEEETKKIEVVYYVKDSYQKSTEEIEYIYIYPDSTNKTEVSMIRFISEEYKNSLEEQSLWKEEEYNELLEASYQGTHSTKYSFTKETVTQIKDWIKTNQPSTNSNELFVEKYIEESQQ